MTLRVLGIDPGSRVTGFGVVDSAAGGLRCVASGAIRLPDCALDQRLRIIYTQLAQVIQAQAPDIMAVEKVFMARNAQSALVLGQARGAAVVVGANHGVEIVEYSALQIKQAVVGKGKAAKQQVQHMMRVLLGLRETPAEDIADALACAVCHINTIESLSRMQGRIARAAP